MSQSVLQSVSLLSDRAAFKISGADASTFVQGLVTADIAELKKGVACHTGLLTPQGKIMFDFFVLVQDDHLLIDCALSQIDDIVKRLTFYKLRADVVLEKLENVAVASSWGDAPEVPTEIVSYDDPRIAEMGQRLIGPMTMIKALSNQAEGAYHQHRIENGIPDTVDIGTSQTFPHEANFDQLGGVSFTKGCYVGQEVVSRMQHRGTARSRIVPVDLSGALVADLADDDREVSANDKKIGQMLSVVGNKGLAIIRLDRAKKATDEGHAITVGDVVVTLKKPQWAQFEM